MASNTIESRALRVLHISTPASWRGGEQQMAYLAGELKEKDVKQWIACRTGSAVEAFAHKNGIATVAQPIKSGVDPAYARMLAKFCQREQPDVIHTHDAHAHTFAVMATVFWRINIPLVVSRRVDFPVKKSWLSRYKYNHKQVKRILCVSNTIRKITAKGVQRPERCVTVFSGVDPGRFTYKKGEGKLRTEFGLTADLPIVGNVSALAPHKDYFTFFDAVRELVDLGVKAHFLAIGDGTMKTALEGYVRELGLEQHVTFTGFRKDIPEILPELDVFLITSETEGLGTSVLDAFACKVPVVATDAGGIHEMVIDEQTGLLRPIKDHKALAKAVKRLLDDPALAKTLTQNATQKLQGFTKMATAEKTLEVYRALV